MSIATLPRSPRLGMQSPPPSLGRRPGRTGPLTEPPTTERSSQCCAGFIGGSLGTWSRAPFTDSSPTAAPNRTVRYWSSSTCKQTKTCSQTCGRVGMSFPPSCQRLLVPDKVEQARRHVDGFYTFLGVKVVIDSKIKQVKLT